MDIITPISNAIGLVIRLREIAKAVDHAEFRQMLADLSNELADAKMEAASLKTEIVELREENRLLKKTTSASDDTPSGTKWGCYQFEGDDNLYCTACWDTKRQKVRTTRMNSRFRKCPVCGALLGS